MDPNKFADNFFALLDNHQTKKAESQSVKVSSEEKKQNDSLKKDNKDGELNKGARRKDTGNKEQRHFGVGLKRSDLESSGNNKDENVDRRTVRHSSGSRFHVKGKQYKEEEAGSDKQVKPNADDGMLEEKSESDKFFSLLDNFENKLSLDKNMAPKNEKSRNIKSNNYEERNNRDSNFQSRFKTSNVERGFPGGRRNGSRNDCDETTQGECSTNDATLRNLSKVEDPTQLQGNYRRQSEISAKKCFKVMGYKYLESLLDKETSFIITSLASPKSGFQELVTSQPMRPDLLMLIISVLNRIATSEAHQLKVQIFSNTFKPEFIDEIKKFVSLVCVEDNRKRLLSMKTFFRNTLNILDVVVNSLPSTMNEKLKSTLNALNLSMKSLRDEHKIVVEDQLFVQLKELSEQVNSYMEHKSKIEKEQSRVNKKDIPPPNNYKDIPLVPTKEDFMVDRSYLRQNIVKGSYRDVDHYLDIQFRLLREDFIAPLREGIFEYIESLAAPRLKRRYTSVRIYPKVKFENPFKSRDVFGFYIQFDCEKKLPRHINWEYNKRFMPGSLLLFSDDNFQTFYLATVVERKIDKLKAGLLFITFVPGTDMPEYLFDPGVFFVMAESEVYYEAYKHVLSALQRMAESNFPMKQYIVDVDTACFPPAYLMDNAVYKISSFSVNLLDDNSWPSPEQLQLNPSQHHALKSALTNDFVVIQGPPGTGKTFLALKITEILLKNEVSCNTPIVVICYTNHALDQFLEGILKYTNNLIRIGMQSQNEALQEYNLEEVRKKVKESRNLNLSALFRDTMNEKINIQSKLQIVKEKIEELSTPQGILNVNVLRSVITAQQFNQLAMEPDLVVNWLFCYDDPEFSLERSQEEEVNIPVEKPAAPTQNDSSGPVKGTDIEGEEFEEFDEEEAARRLADLTEDDFFEEDFFQERGYDRQLRYSLKYADIDLHIKEIEYNLGNTPFVNDEAEYYFKMQSKEQIKNLEWQGYFLQKLLCKFQSFKFNPERFFMFQNAGSVWDINSNDRGECYVTWVYLYICQLKQIVQHLTKIYQDVLMKLHELRQMEDLRFVQSASVVGLTTSGAAKRRVLLENLGTKIVIVEEAAEVLEAHIVTSLAQSVQHVILIGDHKQLKPNPAVFKLAKMYNMDCSLFERMLNNGLGCSVLNEQHRMRPEMASLITPVIYPHLVNHPSTLDRPKIKGVDRFVFFLTHQYPEDQLPDSSSKQNTHEADLLLELCKYLLLNEYKPDEITILATYTGQVWYMKRKRREIGVSLPEMKAVRITPVDNFQGEENRIILLSLVRSNKENKIGFLSTENRVCVALSRAKEGLYVVGNMDNLTNNSTIWPKIKQRLELINAFGQKLTLRCERHPDQITQVTQAKDFKAVPDGGCALKCKAELNCGHLCPKVCHIIDRDHGFYKCQEKCNRPPCLVQGHKCPLRCWELCEPCVIPVEKDLPCGHKATLKCHEEPAAHKCLEEVPAVHPDCNHEIFKFCFQDVNHCWCTNPCSSRLPCGHACARKCHVADDPDHLKYKCMKDCVREYTGCRTKQHPCTKRCYEECEACQVPVPMTLPCGHHHEIPCSADPETIRCHRNCKRIMTCGHECKQLCWVTCDPNCCNVKVDKKAPCGHIMTKIKCNESTDKRVCKENCLRKLACGHQCGDKCCNDCTKYQCKEPVDSCVAPLCGHPVFKIPCHLNKRDLHGGSDELVQLCQEPCGQRLSCLHQCKGTCGKCLQGRLHVPCQEECSKILVCGHKCKSKCGILCPPCLTKKCLLRCSHGQCFVPNTKNHTCFVLGNHCDRTCLWRCEHHQCKRRCGEECDRPPCYEPCPDQLACGHSCMGFCGDPCPPYCGVCDGNHPETGPGNRYVVLEDCQHVVGSNVMETLVADATRNGTFRLMVCPVCSVPVANTLRYRNIYFGFRKQIVKIEELVRVEETLRLQRMLARHAELLQSDPTISSTMNMLMKACSYPFKGSSLSAKDMARLIVGCLLQPLAVRCQEMRMSRQFELSGGAKSEGDQRLGFRLEYLATSLMTRMDQISYEAILQIELMVVNILRLTSTEDWSIPVVLWYEVKPYTWERDSQYSRLEPVARLSVTLKTRDSAKRWFQCNKNHLYVSENGETCVTCEDEMKENQRRLEEETKQKEIQVQRESKNKYEGGYRGRQGPAITDYRKSGGRGRGNRGGGGGPRGKRGRGNQRK